MSSFSPTFAKILIHGSKKEIKRIVLVVVFYFNSCLIAGYSFSLGVVDLNYSFCNYFFCAGHGYYINRRYHIKKSRSMRDFLLLFDADLIRFLPVLFLNEFQRIAI